MPSDGPLPHATLLEQQAFLRRLARSLVSDAHRADDLAQDATLAALEHAPSNATSLRSWLARVVRNRAVNLGLADERRRAREQSAPRAAPPRSPDELEEHFQVQRRVMAAVDRLDEPYRSAILLRYYRDLAPTAIAEQLGVPVATVKSRLARALARLRAELDDGDQRGSHAWIAVLAGGLGELHRPVTATALAAGGLAMGLKLAFSTAAACGALALGGWWLLHPVEPTLASSSLPSEEDLISPTALPGSDRVALQDAQVESRQEALAQADATTRLPQPPAWLLTLEIRGFDERDRGPVSIAVHSGSPPIPTWAESSELASSIPLALDGIFEDVEVRPDQITLLIDHPAYLPARVSVLIPRGLRDPDVHAGQLTAAVDLVRAKAIVTGKVEIAVDRPDVLAQVASFGLREGRPEPEPIEIARPDQQGRFRLRLDDAEHHAIVALDERSLTLNILSAQDGNVDVLRPDTRILTVPAGQELDIGTLRLEVGESIDGFVDSSEQSKRMLGHVRAQLQTHQDVSWKQLVWMEDRFELKGALADWSPAGEFHLMGLAPVRYVLVAVPNYPLSEKYLGLRRRSADNERVVAASASGVRIAMEQVRAYLEVRAEGQPVPEARLEVVREDGSTTTYTDEEGRITMLLDPHHDLHLVVSDTRHRPKEVQLGIEQLTAVERFVIELEGPAVEPGTLEILPVADEQVLDERVWLSFRLYQTSTTPPKELESARRLSPISTSGGGGDSVSLSGSGKQPTLTRNGETRVISGLPAGHYLLRILPRLASRVEGECFVVGDIFEFDVPSGGRFVQDWHPRLGGTVRFNFSGTGPVRSAEMLGSEQESLPVRFLCVDPDLSGQTRRTGAPSLSGISSSYPALLPGHYMLRIRMTDESLRSIPFQLEAGKVTDVTVDLSKL